ncbi:protein rep [Burkholderia cenocepacia]|uniref:protein rep n=1 Tax=Burkholderia cenocepacia TaxID=95486 RepID=UPI001B9E056E|nr:protein rep [Burkholderia cenocepacia]MBR8030373.1 protein rep [Burkholderia cenocepacia]MBR8174274.1 protein rep [Burkholderia cenocepacia]
MTVGQSELFVNTAPANPRAPAAGEDARGGGGAALGNLPKSIGQIREVVDEKTGEIQRFRLDSKRREYVPVVDDATAVNEARSGRFMLQRVSRRVLRESKNPRGVDWRVVGCTHRRVSAEVAVLRNKATARARFGGLRICGSVWTCPVCAAKISEHRRAEIHAATDTHTQAGGGIYMLTLTFSHKRADNVALLVKALKRALKLLRDHRTYKQCKQYIDYVGLIRALEVTYGDANGWHPHVHELWLTAKKLTRAQLRLVQKEIFEAWRVACVSAGLGEPNRKQGVTFIEAESAQEYVVKFGREPKWGVGSELAKAHTKKGRLASLTPFDLLRLAGDGDRRAASLFETFAQAFYGSRQLFWSRGLKKLFGIVDMSDEEVAELESDEAELVTRISADEWRAVLRQPFDARGLVLELAENGGSDAVERFVSGLRRGVSPP